MIRKALIPVAGAGRRMAAITRSLPKAMLPLPDSSGRLRPAVHLICAQAASAGIAEVGLIHAPKHAEMLRRHLDAARRSGENDLPERIEYIAQPHPLGLGDAIACGREFVGPDEPGVLVLLGDHMHLADAGAPPCAAQVAAAFESTPAAAMVGMQTVGPDELAKVGVAAGTPLGESIYRCSELIEKPTLRAARHKLVTPGLSADSFLAHCGIYAFGPEIFECIEAARAEMQAGGEIELTASQRILLGRHPNDYYLIKVAGRAYDIGTPAGYAEAFRAVSGL